MALDAQSIIGIVALLIALLIACPPACLFLYRKYRRYCTAQTQQPLLPTHTQDLSTLSISMLRRQQTQRSVSQNSTICPDGLSTHLCSSASQLVEVFFSRVPNPDNFATELSFFAAMGRVS
ncbi:hypothetical protein IQ06DRAFT_16366 [Phaeosphaeriaceae sp. SRC1lsM3a]|nr:hypothetical protein IQ06DRAFT_16366 [Stagonospora sp. SRC1lsM3a]